MTFSLNISPENFSLKNLRSCVHLVANARITANWKEHRCCPELMTDMWVPGNYNFLANPVTFLELMRPLLDA